MNKSEVCNRPGWTAGRVKKFLEFEFWYERYGYHGRYTEYEYSLAQILEAEKSADWRKEAARYLKVAVDNLDAKVASILEMERARHIANEARAASLTAELLAKREAEELERRRLTAIVRGGLSRIGCLHPLSDGFTTFEVPDVLDMWTLLIYGGESTATISGSSTVCGLRARVIAIPKVSCVS